MNLNQVTLPVTNMDECKVFYKKLGFQQVVDSENYARFESQKDDATFSLHIVDEVYRDSGFIIYFECTDLYSKVSELESNGIMFETQPTKQEWLWTEAYLRDPSGNMLCLYVAGRNRLNPPWRLK